MGGSKKFLSTTVGKKKSPKLGGYVLHSNRPSEGGRGEEIDIPITTTADAKQLLTDLDIQEGHNKNVPYDVSNAYDYYQGSGYYLLNKAMLNEYDNNGNLINPLDAKYQEKVDLIQSGAKPLGKAGIYLYRYQGMEFLDNLKSMYGVKNYTDLAGKVAVFNNFLSMTVHPDMPTQFWDKPHFVIFEDVPKDIRGHIMGNKYEGEFLANRHTMIEIKSVEKVGAYWVTRVKIIAQGNKKFS